MKSPFTGGSAYLEQTWRTERFRREAFHVFVTRFVCEETGEPFTTEEQDQLVQTQIHNQYRSLHRIPFPAEINSLRESYGLSAAKMSEVLDFGINSYRQYEMGEIPALANAKLIRLAEKPENMLAFAQEKKSIFSANAYKKLILRIEELIHMPRESEGELMTYLWNSHTEANSFTGFVKPNFKKVANFVLFFAEQVKPMKTKLNKLLFYADFSHFQQTGFAISGCNYRAIQHGPVPSHFRELFGILESKGYVNIESTILEHGEGERFLPGQSFDDSLFTEKELAHMRAVANRFGEMRSRELVEMSHQEKGWEVNQEKRKLIDYQAHAFELVGTNPNED
ncbi:MAG: type II toxin-antitoxin system antitoxin SocA domain-containing protein [Bacteroidota bacterium]